MYTYIIWHCVMYILNFFYPVINGRSHLFSLRHKSPQTQMWVGLEVTTWPFAVQCKCSNQFTIGVPPPNIYIYIYIYIYTVWLCYNEVSGVHALEPHYKWTSDNNGLGVLLMDEGYMIDGNDFSRPSSHVFSPFKNTRITTTSHNLGNQSIRCCIFM